MDCVPFHRPVLGLLARVLAAFLWGWLWVAGGEQGWGDSVAPVGTGPDAGVSVPNEQSTNAERQAADRAEQERPALVLWWDAGRLDGTPNEPLDGESIRRVDAWRGLQPTDSLTGLEQGGAERYFSAGTRTPPRATVAVQSSAESQPQLKSIAGRWVVSFDGENDHLRVLNTGLRGSDWTVFVACAAFENPGDFRGILSANAPQARDYQSGWTIDLGPGPTRDWNQINVEGRGFGGAESLRTATSPFGSFHILQVAIDSAAGTTRLSVDGRSEGQRPYQPADLSMAELTLGARFYTNGPGEQTVRGPAAVDLAEILVFQGVLSPADSAMVHDYLREKYASFAGSLASSRPRAPQAGIEWTRVPNPPLVQMLQAGFQVDELPLEMTNINNVRYRSDGKLVTLGYNGDLHLLTDTDGDGLEDQAEIFWRNDGSLRGPIGMVLTPPDYPLGRGVFVAAKGKVCLILDVDGDDRADQEILVASGWEEIPQNVDAVGMAMGPDGSLYFGLGTANFANGYLIDDAGVAQYDLLSERGTVQRVSPDFRTRETVATGIRFPIAFAFNHLGDLFCTEQEGATWLANGNPFDELLHIPLEPFAGNPTGLRHYGFPPRHPRHNPSVIDEPSTFDYGPQHQSTCGMVFNESVAGGPTFGPAGWRDNALVCGESRGKIWRTFLTKTPVGYVADSQLIAALQMLTVDACVSPRGDLIVACHSGPPDWGTGPLGIGKLFRIRMTQPEAARPVAAWASSPQEIQIAFDQPLDPLAVAGLGGQTTIHYGQYVRAGDRYENLVPPYAVVQRQLQQPRFAVPVYSASVTPDLRTLILNTGPLQAHLPHAILLDFPQGPTEVDLTGHGVQANWNADSDDTPAWRGVLPHLDLQVARHWTADSAEHQRLWSQVSQPGTLVLETTLDLRDLLRPAVQVGETLDFELPPELVSFALNSDRELQVTAQWRNTADGTTSDRPSEPLPCQVSRVGDRHVVALSLPPTDSPWVRIQVRLRTGGELPLLYPCFWTAEDASRRPLQRQRHWLPWVSVGAAELEPVDLVSEKRARLTGGDWGRGRRLFQSEQAQCYKCHRMGADSGGEIGPDLGNLVHRDYDSVMRDIQLPSFSINPDYVTQVLEMTDGRVLTGVLRSRGEAMLVGDAQGNVTEIRAADVARLQPLAQSTMPDHLLEKLDPQQRLDLMTYLLLPAPSMPLESPLKAPPLRTRAEVAAALADSQPFVGPGDPLSIVLVDGVKDHGPGEHDYPAWQLSWKQLLRSAENITVSTARDFPSAAQLESADVIIFFQKGRFDGHRPAQLDKFLARGGGIVLIHWAVNGDDQVRDFAQRIGLASWGGRIKYRHGPLTLDVRNFEHPIVRNFQTLQLYDESYWELTGDPGEITLLATSTEDGVPTPQMWTREHDSGRVFVSIPGHYSWTFDDPLFRILLLRGIAWTAGQPIDRFNELVPLGARISP